MPAACVPEEVRPNFLGFGDRAFVLDITDEKAPVKTSQIMLADIKFSNCGPAGGGPSTAYHEVDGELNTHYAVIGFEAGGLRIFDVRDPRNPVEVAYWNHGRAEHTKSYVVPETGQIWASDASGFWVLELEPQVRQRLVLTSVPTAVLGGRALAAQASGSAAPTEGLPATGATDMWDVGAVLLLVALVLRYQLRARALPL